jgi:hypothetical protein
MELYNINLINASNIKAICPEVPKTVDDSLISGFIIDIQEAYVETILGCAMYQEILGQFSGGTMTALNQYIFDRFIVKILAKRAAIRLMYSSQFQFENAGLRVKESDQSRPAELNEIATLKQFYETEADRIGKDMALYIAENINDYPLFYESTFYQCNCKSQSAYRTRIKFRGL